jgi:hypothetical protein
MSRCLARVSVTPAFPLLLLLVLVGIAGCAEPPRKEMDQAQGAVDAARAAGADEYAPDELSEAVAALARADEAVEQRDYRQALNHALDARERAQAAARDAANRKAEARSDADRAVKELADLLDVATARRDVLRARSAPADVSTALDEAIAAGWNALQEARTAITNQRFIEASASLRAPTAQLQAQVEATERFAEATPPPRPARRPR